MLFWMFSDRGSWRGWRPPQGSAPLSVNPCGIPWELQPGHVCLPRLLLARLGTGQDLGRSCVVPSARALVQSKEREFYCIPRNCSNSCGLAPAFSGSATNPPPERFAALAVGAGVRSSWRCLLSLCSVPALPSVPWPRRSVSEFCDPGLILSTSLGLPGGKGRRELHFRDLLVLGVHQRKRWGGGIPSPSYACKCTSTPGSESERFPAHQTPQPQAPGACSFRGKDKTEAVTQQNKTQGSSALLLRVLPLHGKGWESLGSDAALSLSVAVPCGPWPALDTGAARGSARPPILARLSRCRPITALPFNPAAVAVSNTVVGTALPGTGVAWASPGWRRYADRKL
ncbi:uncharacterized protein LOC126648051 isoform X2 [Myiozetetes cayanensis]|uniref:uncharacterized protein LOC126648051 isoform X2 n=1 Tax=Myiozetetes cayanensis TaxID=478635 RepID=UPI00215F46D6|nr:uncharacterized protein LOC126648051 isoform X2 [Myiozetetes cayanensis]